MNTTNQKIVVNIVLSFFFLLATIIPALVFTKTNVVLALPLTPPITPPIGNHPPYITTFRMNWGKIGIPYAYTINATDQDSDYINIRLTGLPPGLRSVCTLAQGKTSCLVQGTPTTTGMYSVIIKATDQHGLSSKRNVFITIIK